VQHAKTVNGESLIWVVIDSELTQFCADIGREYHFPQQRRIAYQRSRSFKYFHIDLEACSGLTSHEATDGENFVIVFRKLKLFLCHCSEHCVVNLFLCC